MQIINPRNMVLSRFEAGRGTKTMYMITLIKGRGFFRISLIEGAFGSGDLPVNHMNHKYHVVNGVDNGNGYMGYASVSYFLKSDECTPQARRVITEIAEKEQLIIS